MPTETRREADYQDRVGNTTNKPLQDIEGVPLLLTGIRTFHVVVAGPRRHLPVQLLHRPQLAEANIDCLRTMTVHPLVTTVPPEETTVWIVYGTSRERGMMRGIETATLTDGTMMMAMDAEMIDIILLGMTEGIMETTMIDIGDRE